jgi:HEAT repeat protein
MGNVDDRSTTVGIRAWTRALLVFAICVPTSTARDGTTPDRATSPIANLKSKDLETRRAAAARLRTASREVRRDALPALIELLMKEKDGQVRLAVLDTVTASGADAAAAVPALVHTLRTDYGGQRQEESHQDYRSAVALAAIGKPAVEGLSGLLKERKESVRAEVVMALGRIGPDAEAAVPDLVPLLGDRSERIRREASRALGRIGPAAVTPLLAASAREEPIVCARAVEGLGYLAVPDDRVVQSVLKCARHTAPEVREAAIVALARFRLPDEALLPVVEPGVGDEAERVRLAVVDVLAERRALLTRLAPKLEGLLTARDEGTARHAAFLLSRTGPEAAPRLLGALRHDTSRIEPIAEALAQIGRPAATLLSQAVGDPDPRVRRGAALALGRIRPVVPGTASKLTAGLSDPDGDVRAAFLTAIGSLGSRAGEAVPAVRGLLNDRSPENRMLALEFLARATPRDDRLLTDIAPLLKDADPRVERRTIDVIRTLGPRGFKAMPEIVGKLDSQNPDVRLAAVEFVESHGPAAAGVIPQLTRLLDDPTPRVRTIAARALGGLGKAAQPAFARLTPLLGARQVEVREAATTAIGSLELDAGVIRPHLARALGDENSEVRRAASRAILKLGPQGALFIPDIILLAEKKENARSVERLLRRFERAGPDVRSLPELVKELGHKQDRVRLLAIKFLGLAGRNARDALPALERMRDDPNGEVRKQAQAACDRIKNPGASAQRNPASPSEG